MSELLRLSHLVVRSDAHIERSPTAAPSVIYKFPRAYVTSVPIRYMGTKAAGQHVRQFAGLGSQNVMLRHAHRPATNSWSTTPARRSASRID